MRKIGGYDGLKLKFFFMLRVVYWKDKDFFDVVGKVISFIVM